KLYQASYQAQFISGTIQPAMTFISNLNYVAIAVIGGLRVASGQMSLGDVVAFIQYSRQFTFPIIQTASIVNVLQSAVASAERVFELLDEREQSADPVGAPAFREPKGAVSFEDISFRYEPDKPLIEDLSLNVAAGRTVATLPDGYETVIDDDATNVSAGEKQLLTIARAFLADPPILILDEATSSVDTRTEVLIQRAMARLMRGRTTFVIAHRLSTIRDADTILVMPRGRIVEQGTHDELLARGGAYAD